MHPQRILINMLSAGTGGGMTYARNIVPLLHQRLDEALVLTGGNLHDSPDTRTTITAPGYWTVGAKRFAWEAVNLSRLITKYGVRTLYTPYQVAVQPRRVKSVCALRNMEPFFSRNYPYSLKSGVRNDLLRALTKRHLGRADLVIAVSNFARQYAREVLAISDDRLVTIYHGRDESFIDGDPQRDQSVREGIGVNLPYILSAGSLLPYRRVEDVIAAYEAFIKSCSAPVLLVVAGSGTDLRYRHKIEDQVAVSPYRDYIRFVGYVDRETMRSLYKGSSVFVSASEIEACPNIGIEAMTAGCAVIAAEAGPAREIYGDGAQFYEPRRVEHLCSLFQLLLRDGRQNTELREKAIRRSETFSWKNCANQTAAALRSL